MLWGREVRAGARTRAWTLPVRVVAIRVSGRSAAALRPSSRRVGRMTIAARIHSARAVGKSETSTHVCAFGRLRAFVMASFCHLNCRCIFSERSF